MQLRSASLLFLVVASSWHVATLSFADEVATQQDGLEQEQQYNRDIRPILAEHCFACHGLDSVAREAELRLDERKVAVDSGAIVPGKPDQSELMARLTATDPEMVMPPPETGHKLSSVQVSILKQWIAEGAQYQRHWSFISPRKVDFPETVDDQWATRPIDRFVLHRLEQSGLPPSGPTDRASLLRRVSLDITGLPPTLEQAREYLSDSSPEAYEALVDRLLESENYGEHWARMWLDLARYADTKGYEKDRHRDIWRYRDWVIDAFNRDLPFDQFTIEQLGGDLLPERTDDQILATAFHRNTMTNDEGGTDNEEFRIAAVKDRVDTTMQVWMGLTMGCAKCHSHKYDPISIRDYYSFFAYFNQTQDADNEAPFYPTPTAEQTHELTMLAADLQRATELSTQRPGDFAERFEAWKQLLAENPLWQPLSLVEFKSEAGVQMHQDDQARLIASGDRPEKDTWQITFELPLLQGEEKYTSLRIEHFPQAIGGGEWVDKNVAVRELTVELIQSDGTVDMQKMKNPRATFSQKGWNVAAAVDGKPDAGWGLSPRFTEPQAALFDFEKPIAGGTLKVTLEQQYGEGLLLGRSRFSISRHPVQRLRAELQPALEETFSKTVFPETMRRIKEVETAKNRLDDLKRRIPKTPVMLELGDKRQRKTRIHNRGNFLDQSDEVSPSVLVSFGNMPPEAPVNRLGVARWLVQADNPLTARVMVNRIWARIFGIGLVETEEDFGTQGMLPSHPMLLDWLAVDFREQGWSIKRLIKTIVMSKTYRQSPAVSEKALEIDPRNRLLSRGPRFRLSAEMVRDQALAVAGLLVTKVGGPSVMPPQPTGIWKSTYSGEKWKNSVGPDRFRRGLYTYLKRTSPYPAMTTFDAGSGEVCQIRRIRTNTPLQALVTLNDVVFMEAAGALAKRMESSGKTLPDKFAAGFQMVLVRKADGVEIDRLVALYDSLENEMSEGQALLHSAKVDSGDPRMVVIANVLLNLDETLMKP
ncbi:MAG: PSD1 and planctomycete cytochrome C domain-containing protein [Rubripirellula sp.]|nr:PSD1 and planctomycete cytochrome C domain-containing protein [Rubripirellula sp.]